MNGDILPSKDQFGNNIVLLDENANPIVLSSVPSEKYKKQMLNALLALVPKIPASAIPRASLPDDVSPIIDAGDLTDLKKVQKALRAMIKGESSGI